MVVNHIGCSNNTSLTYIISQFFLHMEKKTKIDGMVWQVDHGIKEHQLMEWMNQEIKWDIFFD